MHCYHLIVLACSGLVRCIPTTMKTYDIEVPGSNPIRIFEDATLWEYQKTTPLPIRNRFEHRSFSFTTDKTKTSISDPVSDNDEDFSTKFHPEALTKFLESYAEKIKNSNFNEQENEDIDEDEIRKAEVANDNKSKSWNLLHVQKHNHPFDDKKGWVSLEPVPWSVSKISKWQSNKKHQGIYEANNKPWINDFIESGDDYQQRRPSWNSKPSKPYRPNGYNDDQLFLNQQEEENLPRPIYSKPTTTYGQKIQIYQGTEYDGQNRRTGITPRPHKDNCDRGEIITDGNPPNFPDNYYEMQRRRGTDVHPETYPVNGNGDWVLLSTTRGYKYPASRQRAINFDRDSIGTRKSVKLTVLPPLKNSKVNMTTSHGGLLQVESTFESVEQAQKQYQKKQKLKQKPSKVKKPITQANKNQYQERPTQYQAKQPLTTKAIRRRHNVPDSSAVLAAVGAGMIPATMAMLMPMALNGRKKRHTLLIANTL